MARRARDLFGSFCCNNNLRSGPAQRTPEAPFCSDRASETLRNLWGEQEKYNQQLELNFNEDEFKRQTPRALEVRSANTQRLPDARGVSTNSLWQVCSLSLANY